MGFSTADLSDSHAAVSVCEPGLRDYGAVSRFFGRIATVKAPNDNTKVRKALEEPGQGRVLVVDGAASRTCALLGDQLGELAQKNGWAGVVVYGCVRDSEALGRLKIGVKALATHPRKSEKKDRGEREVELGFLGVTFTPGHWLYADADGVVVSATELYIASTGGQVSAFTQS